MRQFCQLRAYNLNYLVARRQGRLHMKPSCLALLLDDGQVHEWQFLRRPSQVGRVLVILAMNVGGAAFAVQRSGSPSNFRVKLKAAVAGVND